MKYLNRCKAIYESFDDGSRVVKLQIVFIIIIFIPAIIMLTAIKYFVSKRSKDNQIPAKFGRYQRNLLTFAQTVTFFIGFIGFEVALAFVITFLENNSISRQGFKSFSLLLVLLFACYSDNIRKVQIGAYLSKNLILSVVMPMSLIFDLSRKGFFIIVKESKYEGFTFVNEPKIEPRRQVVMHSRRFQNDKIKKCCIVLTKSESLPNVEC